MPGSHRTGSLLVTASVVLALLIAALPGVAGAATADDSVAQAGVLVATDLGRGWTAREASTTHDATLYRDVPACRRVRPVTDTVAGRDVGSTTATSAHFNHGPIDIENRVTILPNARVAAKAVKAIGSSDYRTCLQRAEERALASVDAPSRDVAKILKSVSVSVSSKTLVLPVKARAGMTMTISSKLGQQRPGAVSGNLVQVRVVVRVGRALDAFQFSYASGLEGRVTAAQLMPSIRRLRAALAG